MSVPAASWCDPAGESPAQVRSSVRLVASVAWPLATVGAKRTQRLHGVAVLLDALNRYRGKEGQQKVTGEHGDVHAGGQAVVGMIESPRGGDQPKSEDQPRAKQIGHAPQPAVWSADKERQRLPVSGDAERPLPNARRDVSGRPEG